MNHSSTGRRPSAAMVLDRGDWDEECTDIRTTAGSMPLFRDLGALCARDRARFRRVASGIATQLRSDAEKELYLSSQMLTRLADLLDRAAYLGDLSELDEARARARTRTPPRRQPALGWQFVMARAGWSYRALARVA